MTTKATIAITAIACLVIGAAAGYLGTASLQSFQHSPSQLPGRQQGNFSRREGQGGQPFGGGRVIGQVQSVSDGRITVQTPDNSSQIVLLNDSTSYQRTVEGSATDVTAGTQVIVTGEQNPDGSTTASSIQIVPAGMNFPFGSRSNK